MAVEEQRGPGRKSGHHAEGFPGIELDENEASPVGTIAFGFGLELVEEGLLEFQEFEHAISGDERVDGSGRFGKQDVLKLVGAGGDDGGAFIDFGGIEQVEDRKTLNGKDFVHALEAEAALAIEEIGDMGLFESGLLGESEPGELSVGDPFPKDLTEIVLQDLELH